MGSPSSTPRTATPRARAPQAASPQQLAHDLRAVGLVVTPQRLAILGGLRRACDHPSPEVLHLRLRHGQLRHGQLRHGQPQQRRRDLSLATVYKALHAFARAGLVHEVNVAGDNRRRFDGNLDRHHHLVCRACHEVRDLYDTRLDAVAPPPNLPGFQAEGLSVNVLGRCAACASGASGSARIHRRPGARGA